MSIAKSPGPLASWPAHGERRRHGLRDRKPGATGKGPYSAQRVTGHGGLVEMLEVIQQRPRASARRPADRALKLKIEEHANIWSIIADLRTGDELACSCFSLRRPQRRESLQSGAKCVEFTKAGQRAIAGTNTIDHTLGLETDETQRIAAGKIFRAGTLVAAHLPLAGGGVGSVGRIPIASNESVLGGEGERQAME